MILLWAKMLGEKANIDKGAGFDLTEEVNLLNLLKLPVAPDNVGC